MPINEMIFSKIYPRITLKKIILTRRVNFRLIYFFVFDLRRSLSPDLNKS